MAVARCSPFPKAAYEAPAGLREASPRSSTAGFRMSASFETMILIDVVLEKVRADCLGNLAGVC